MGHIGSSTQRPQTGNRSADAYVPAAIPGLHARRAQTRLGIDAERRLLARPEKAGRGPATGSRTDRRTGSDAPIGSRAVSTKVDAGAASERRRGEGQRARFHDGSGDAAARVPRHTEMHPNRGRQAESVDEWRVPGRPSPARPAMRVGALCYRRQGAQGRGAVQSEHLARVASAWHNLHLPGIAIAPCRVPVSAGRRRPCDAGRRRSSPAPGRAARSPCCGRAPTGVRTVLQSCRSLRSLKQSALASMHRRCRGFLRVPSPRV